MTHKQRRLILALFWANILVAALLIASGSWRITENAHDPVATENPLLPSPGSVEPDTRSATLRLGERIQATATPAGWTSYAITDKSLAISLPPGWQRLTLDSDGMGSVIARVRLQNPALAAELDQSRQAFGGGVLFFGYETKQADARFLTNATVVDEPLGLDVSLDGYSRATLAELNKVKGLASPITHHRVGLGAGDAEEFRYDLQFTSPRGDSIAITTLQYILIRDRHAYALTLSTTREADSAHLPLFQEIARTLTWTK